MKIIKYKLINGIDHKMCLICKEYFPLSIDYFYINKLNKTDGLHAWCKKCSIKKAKDYQENPKNSEMIKRSAKKRNAKPEFKIKMRKYAKQQRLNGYQKEYRQNNRDKLKSYQIKRRQNKNHEINEKKWHNSLNYFNNSCAYCGITEEEAVDKYKNKLHREHVDHNGANDLSNSVPSCKGCNSRKWEFTLDEWYPKQKFYSKERLLKINKWLHEDYKKFI